MKWIFVFILAISTNTYASHLEKVCKSSLLHDPVYSGRFISNPPVFSGSYVARALLEGSERINVVEDLNGRVIFQSNQEIRGITQYDDSLWLLFEYEIANITKDGHEIARYPFVFNPNPQTAKAISFLHVQDLVLIARGRGGLTAFNMQTGKVEWHKDFTEIDGGRPVAIAFDGKHGQVVFTGTRENGFNGIATLDLESHEVLFQTPYNPRRAGIISPDSRAHWLNDNLILNNGGWIHIISKKQIEEQKPIKPKWLAIEVGEGRDLHYMMLNGDFFIKENSIFACGIINERNGDEITRVAQLFKVKLD